MLNQHVTPGQPVSGALTARQWNEFVDAARAVKAHDGKFVAQSATRNENEILVRNNTGSDLDRFAILAVGNPIISTTDRLQQYKNHPAFEGAAPGSTSTGKFCVLQTPAADGAIVPAVVDGRTVCKVNVSDTSHGYAEVAVGDTAKLASSACGSAQILHVDSGTGEKWATVRLGNKLCDQVLNPILYSPGTVYSETIEARNDLCVYSGLVKIVAANGMPSGCGDGDSALVDTADTITAYNLTGYSVKFGEVVSVAYDGLDWYILDSQDADDTCQVWKGINSATQTTNDEVVIIDTELVDVGDICDTDSNGHIRLKFTGLAEISYLHTVYRHTLGGGTVGLALWLEVSTNNGSSWATLPSSTTHMKCINTVGQSDTMSNPCVLYQATAGDLIRLWAEGLSGPGSNVNVPIEECYVCVKPCGRAVSIEEEDLLIVRWVPRDPPDNPEFPIVPPPDNPDYPDLGLTNNGSITATTGDENPNAWDFNGTNQYFSNATADWLDWSQDFTFRVHFSVDTVGAFNHGTLVFMNDGSTTSNPFGLRVVDASPPHRLMLDVGITVAIVTGLSPSTWYTAYVRYDASSGQFDLDVVGVGNANDTPTYSPVSSPTINFGGSAFFNDDYLDGQIDSLRFWQRRLADWELV